MDTSVRQAELSDAFTTLNSRDSRAFRWNVQPKVLWSRSGQPEQPWARPSWNGGRNAKTWPLIQPHGDIFLLELTINLVDTGLRYPPNSRLPRQGPLNTHANRIPKSNFPILDTPKRLLARIGQSTWTVSWISCSSNIGCFTDGGIDSRPSVPVVSESL